MTAFDFLYEAPYESVTLAAGETLFVEGDPADALYLCQSGRLMLSRNARPLGEARHDAPLDVVATFGLIPHTQRAVALTDCKLLRWKTAKLLQLATIEGEIRRFLAQTLIATQTRLDALQAPIHYAGDGAELLPGPFVFNNTTLLLAFCHADLSGLRLPPGLHHVRPAWRSQYALFLAVADFRDAYYDHQPDARFSYTETTYFIPVRHGRQFGLYPAYIYPSTYEPILLGREIYGFPKRLGDTTLDDHSAALSVDGGTHFRLDYNAQEVITEPRIIRALSDWLGVEGRVTETAFRIGDLLLDTMQIGLKRRVSAYNHKRIPDATTTHTDRRYGIDQLTQAVFSVTTWHSLAHLPDATLTMQGGPLHYAGVTLQAAYLTRLDMRLSTGRVVASGGNPV